MERLKRARKIQRAAFTKCHNTLSEDLSSQLIIREDVMVSFGMLEDKMAELNTLQEKIIDLMLDDTDSAAETNLQKEVTGADEYRAKYLQMKVKVEDFNKSSSRVERNRENASSSSGASDARKSNKFPKIEIPKFNGNVRDWLQFWSQFQKIDKDPDVTLDDKFQYLLQAVVPGTRAHELVQSFPPTGDNYKKAIDAMTERFGNKDLLIEVYVRELLELVLKNVMTKKEKLNLSSLYDKLETHLRALETLGVTTSNCASMLFPLVESSLPEELLRTWQRSTPTTGETSQATQAENRLSALMKFLQAEVQNEERVSMAIQGFSLPTAEDKSQKIKQKSEQKREIATAAGLLSTSVNKTVECIFCKANHDSADCDTARKMTIEKKREIAKEHNCCFNCLKKGHSYNRCHANVKCAWCNKRHAIVMCSQMQQTAGTSDGKLSSKTPVNEHNLASIENTSIVYLQTMWVKIYNDDFEIDARAIIDSGSQRSYITEALARKLGYVSTGQREVIHSLFGGNTIASKTHDIYSIRIKSLSGKYACNFKAMSQEVICGNVECIKPAPWIDYLKSKNVELTDINSNYANVDILIGADVAGKLLTGRRYILENGITAIESRLGWTVMGEPANRQHEDVSLITTSLFLQQADVSELWSLETVGITDPVARKSQLEREIEVQKRFHDTVKINEEGRYEVELPWIEDHVPLPSNESIAKKRLEHSFQKLKAQNLESEYNEIFKEWEKQGIIEKVSSEDLQKPGHYLPHRPVLKENSSTPIRPVYDASAAEKNSPSLNQCLEKGQNLIELMPSILLRFRKRKIGVISDIAKAFLQISLAPTDRNYLRFFWKRDGRLEVYRHCRVVFGVSCSPFLLGATLKLHLQRAYDKQLLRDYSPWTISLLRDSFYVDNCVCSVDNETELQTFIEEATSIMSEGKFVLRSWEHTHDGNKDNTAVLGMIWNKEDDTLSLNLSFLENSLPSIVTKKSILSVTHRIFDPIGVVAPLLLRPKILLQKAWLLKLGWDTEIDGVLRQEFFSWLKGLPALKNLKIPRAVGWTKDDKAHSLHTFCDASGSGYAAAVFLCIDEGGENHVQLLGAKARVAPLKEMTIPRLELLAATIGARLATSISETLNQGGIKSFFWSDSTTVLSWIKTEAQWNTFVWNRVQEIRRLTSPDDWRHVPGEDNPADLPSRGCSAEQLISSRWWEGPPWLKDERQWPTNNYSPDEELINAERKKTATVTMLNCKTNMSHNSVNSSYTWYFSSYLKTVRSVGWMHRFLYNSRKPVELRRSGDLTCDEILNAEFTLLRFVQRETFSSEKDPKLKDFEVSIDSRGLMRIRTKISNRNDAYDFCYPIILDSRHEIIRRLIEYEHKQRHHAGVQILMSALREKYWIITARRLIRSVVHNCVRCKRYMVKRLESSPAPLPEDRVRDARVFEVTGVDFAGPLFLKGNKKAWICLFTCAIYRAIHLELVTSLSTGAFIGALRRFIARRGRPTTIYSDNGTNFVGFENLARKVNWNRISKYSSSRKIEWRFNPPSAAWWGGWWERLVRSVKQTLRKVLGKACVSYEEMGTILCDCEALINSRPLAYVSDDPSDLSPLTPAMFLHDIREVGVPDCDNIDGASLCARVQYQQKLKNDLRERFRVEYLGLLKTQGAVKENRRIGVGDLVLIGDDLHKRIDWPLGVVSSVIPGTDGKIRTVKVKTRKTELTRPIQRLYPLELSLSDDKDKSTVMLKEIDTPKISVIKNKRTKSKKCKPVPSSFAKSKYVTRSGRVVKPKQRLDK